MTLLETLLGVRDYGPLICNCLVGKLKLERIDLAGGDRLSWGNKSAGEINQLGK